MCYLYVFGKNKSTLGKCIIHIVQSVFETKKHIKVVSSLMLTPSLNRHPDIQLSKGFFFKKKKKPRVYIF